jgi:uncharacterized membrane protein YheB (UPF0754 family)
MSYLLPEFIPYVKYIAPPLVGAFIGYLTNRVAIRMLFRPLKAWRLLGLRIPMTPGVIPSKRHQLAMNMGEVVGDHLLTSEEVGKGLQHEVFQNHLYTIIQQRVEGVLQKDMGPVSSIIPEKFHVYLDIGSKTITWQVKHQLNTFIRSEKFTTIVDDAIDARLETFLGHEIGTILPLDKRQIGYAFIEENVSRMFESRAMEQWLEDFVQQKVYSALQQKKSPAEIFPQSLQELLVMTIEKQIPSFLQKLATIVSEPEVREKVVAGACAGVDAFIESLGSMAEMVRGFLKTETVEEKIREYLVDKNDDIVAWLQSDEVQERVVAILRERSSDFLHKPIVDWVKAEDEKVIEDFCKQCNRQILLLVRGQEVAKMFSSMITSNVENHIESGALGIGELFTELLGKNATLEARNWLKTEIRDLLQSASTLKTIDMMVDSLVASLLKKRIGQLSRIVPAGVKEGISKSFQNMASAMLASEVPGLVHSLNIRKIVTEKINSLDLLRLEGLLLSIMEEQFKYINLFGALLGFLIGCLNILFLL